jgi:hypothetical protein
METDRETSEPTGAAGGRATARCWVSRRIRRWGQSARAKKLSNHAKSLLLREVDVVADGRLARSVKQANQGGTLLRP